MNFLQNIKFLQNMSSVCEYIYRKGYKKGIVCNAINCEIHVYKKKQKPVIKEKNHKEDNSPHLINTDVENIINANDELYNLENYNIVNTKSSIYDIDILIKCLINEFQFMLNNNLISINTTSNELSKNFLIYRRNFILNKKNNTHAVLPILYNNYSKIDNYLYNMNDNEMYRFLQSLI